MGLTRGIMSMAVEKYLMFIFMGLTRGIMSVAVEKISKQLDDRCNIVNNSCE